MAIEFSNGFSVTPPIVVGMRSLLSVAGQTAYDAATVGNFFSCSLADYNAVFTGYADAQKIGQTDAEFNTALNAGYSGPCASVLPIGNSTIPANTYIIGFATKMQANPGSISVTPLISISYKGTYTTISNSPFIGGLNRVYYLRKDPPITSEISYVGHVASGGSFDMPNLSYTNAGFDCTPPYSSWVNRTAQMPHFQMFITTTRPY
jgi:hypothetical protein